MRFRPSRRALIITAAIVAALGLLVVVGVVIAYPRVGAWVVRTKVAAKLGARLLHLQHGTLYRLWAPLADPAAARAFALEVAVSKSRRQGLLMNPHSQTLEVLRVWRHESREEGRY